MIDEANRALGPAAVCAKHLDAATEVRCVSADPRALCCVLLPGTLLAGVMLLAELFAHHVVALALACHAVLCVCLVTCTPLAHPASLSLQLASRGELEDSNKYVQVILDMLVQDESEPGMEVKAKTIALLSTWCVAVTLCPLRICMQSTSSGLHAPVCKQGSLHCACCVTVLFIPRVYLDAWAMCLRSHVRTETGVFHFCSPYT
jgi:hypothetical protein